MIHEAFGYIIDFSEVSSALLQSPCLIQPLEKLRLATQGVSKNALSSTKDIQPKISIYNNSINSYQPPDLSGVAAELVNVKTPVEGV